MLAGIAAKLEQAVDVPFVGEHDALIDGPQHVAAGLPAVEAEEAGLAVEAHVGTVEEREEDDSRILRPGAGNEIVAEIVDAAALGAARACSA